MTVIIETVETALVHENDNGTFFAKLVSADTQGSSAFYPASILKRDGSKVFKAGTPVFKDHQTIEESSEKPFGSTKDYVGELAEDAEYRDNGPDGAGLYAPIRIFEDARTWVKERAKNIGLSIRGKARKDRTGAITELLSARSVDFVMKPGAGGHIIGVMESAIIKEEDSAENPSEQENNNEGNETLAITEEDFNSLKASVEGLSAKVETLTADSVHEEAAPKTLSLEDTKALAVSGLSESAIDRVVTLFQASDKTIAELVESEKAYIEEAAKAASHEEGFGVFDDDIHESATEKYEVPVLNIWNRKKKA